MTDLTELRDQVVEGAQDRVKALLRQALDEGISPEQILHGALVAGMAVVGKKFQAHEFFLPDMLMAARAMKGGLEILNPLLPKGDRSVRAKVAIGTVSGDLHDIGKNLVITMWEGAGFEVVDLGIDVTPEKFVAAAANGGIQLVGMSALLTTTMMGMKTSIEALVAAGVRNKVKVMVGGAPITQEFAAEIGADGYAPNAADAVDRAKTLLGMAG